MCCINSDFQLVRMQINWQKRTFLKTQGLFFLHTTYLWSNFVVSICRQMYTVLHSVQFVLIRFKKLRKYLRYDAHQTLKDFICLPQDFVRLAQVVSLWYFRSLGTEQHKFSCYQIIKMFETQAVVNCRFNKKLHTQETSHYLSFSQYTTST